MGLLDAFMPGETAGIPNGANMGGGLLDFLKTPQGQAIASGLATYAATARRGTPINNIGRGIMGGVTGYSNAIQSQQEAADRAAKAEYNRKQQELLGMHYGNETMRAQTERNRLLQQKKDTENFNKFTLPGFQKALNIPISVAGYDENGEPVFAEMPEGGSIQPISFDQPTGFIAQLDPDMRDLLAQQLNDPKGRNQAIGQLYKMYADSKKTTKAAGLSNFHVGDDGRLYGYDKSTNSMMPVGGEFKPKEKGPIVDMRGAVFGAQEKFSEGLGGQLVKEDFIPRRTKALEAIQGVETIHEARRLLDSGAITGFGANALVGIGRALQKVGINYARDPVANTEAFTAVMAREVGLLIKQFGSGTGLSDADREFATKMAGGDITVSETGIRRILDINERARRNAIRTYNKDAKEVMKQPYAQQLPYSLIVDEPVSYGLPVKGGQGQPSKDAPSQPSKLTPAEQAELDALRKRFGK